MILVLTIWIVGLLFLIALCVLGKKADERMRSMKRET